ncbi:uncharacterized protein B0J16DRAFT_329482 [Fusarium flagelliforme]|uniref:uncharacterized protein n=1 Tax=Fusarium flagelliforme TaxID=2675880 RepID=UPI001E8D3E8A|nr:uncharacterized protein B0J16DRAFT_329482 [Fusarium flagelliforme]KAH7197960.1 hypothetical protein B0J16DRAFT_329482 [Fusarium flagelliforme]
MSLPQFLILALIRSLHRSLRPLSLPKEISQEQLLSRHKLLSRPCTALTQDPTESPLQSQCPPLHPMVASLVL